MFKMYPNSHSTDTRTELMDPWTSPSEVWEQHLGMVLAGEPWGDMQDPHICIEADPQSKMHGVPSHARDQILPAYLIMPFALWKKKLKVLGLFHGISLFFIMQRFCKMVSWDQPFIALITKGVCRRLYYKTDTWRGKQLPSETMFVPFPFKLLFL